MDNREFVKRPIWIERAQLLPSRRGYLSVSMQSKNGSATARNAGISYIVPSVSIALAGVPPASRTLAGGSPFSGFP
jgi:hypothetical protein